MAPWTDFRYWGFFVLGLLSLLLLMGAAAMVWHNRTHARTDQRLPSRPGAATLARAARSGAGGHWFTAPAHLAKRLAGLPGFERYDRLVQQTGWPIDGAAAILGSALLALAAGALALLAGAPLLLVPLSALLAALSVQGVLLWQAGHRGDLLGKQLPDALSLIARSMQAGHAFSSALQIAAQESPSPISGELRGVFNEIQYGEGTNEALGRWATRVAGEDVRIFVIAVRIQSETGGNLAELLHQTAALIRERQKLRGVVRVLSAEGRISAVVLTLLPFGLAGLLTTLNPAFMAQLWTDPLGLRLLLTALALMGLGMLWMWQLVRVQP